MNAETDTTAPSDLPVEIRAARPEDADSLVRCFYDAYGDSYDHGWVYDPDAIRQRWQDRLLVSIVGLDPEGQVVGHLAANLETPAARVAESGQALVSHRYRGHHLFESIKGRLADWAADEGLYGLFSEATTAHPYSQRGNLALGAHEMGFLFGYVSDRVEYKRLVENEAHSRKSAALMYLRTNREPDRMVHVPQAYRAVAMSVYENAGFARTAGTESEAATGAACRLSVERDRDRNAALLRCTAVGPDMGARIAEALAALRDETVACVWLDLPLADPATAAHGAELGDMGFVFSCILPEVRADGDVLRLQYLNGVDVHAGEIATSSDFARALLDDMLAIHAKS